MMVEQFDRLSKYSLNPDNQKMYANKKEQWEKVANQNNVLTNENTKILYENISSKSYVVNEKLRNEAKLSYEEKKMVDRLNETLNKMPKYNDNLQRSVYFKFEKVVEKYVKQFLSTTKGQVYNEDGQVQIYIQNAHNGRDISSVNAQEQEVLYKTNQRFKVLNKERLMINIISCCRNIMSEELKKGIPLFETTGEIVKRTKEDKERYDKDFEKILKEAGVLKENQSIKEIKHIDQ